MHTSEFAAVAAQSAAGPESNRMSLNGNTVLRLPGKGETHWTHYMARFCTAGITASTCIQGYILPIYQTGCRCIALRLEQLCCITRKHKTRGVHLSVQIDYITGTHAGYCTKN